MKITHSELKDLTSVIKLTLEPADYQAAVEKQIIEVRKKAQMPGFRPGNMPKQLVKKMYGKGIMADVLNNLIGENLTKYIDEQKFHILGDPLANDAETDKIDFDTMDTFTFAFDIAVAPEFEVSIDGRTKLPVYEVEVTDKMVEDQVNAYANRFGEYIAPKEGDEENKEGKVIPAEINGELFAKVYGENNIKDEADFRAHVRQEIEANMEQESKFRFGIDAKAAILKKVGELKFPEEFLKRWILTQNKETKAEDLEKDFPKMLEDLKWQLAKDKMLKAADVKVEKEDVEAYAKQVAKMQFMQYGLMHVEDEYLANFAQSMLKDENQLRNLVERVAEGKLYDYVKGVAKIENKKIGYEEFNKLFE